MYSLASGTVIGATSFATKETINLLAIGNIIAIDTETANCEIRVVTNVSGKTVTFNSALELSHSANALVYVSLDGSFHPSLFACKGDNSTDDWQGLQRMLYQSSRLFTNMIYGPLINGGGNTYRVQQPLTFSKHSMSNMQINCFTSFGQVDANNALMMSASQNHYPFTATAVDDTFFSTGATVFPGINEPVVFNNMYGETLPGNVVPGRVYFVKTRVDSKHITVSDTQGGATLDITSDGAGWTAGQIGELTKFWWKDVSLNIGIADLNGLIMGSQQPADIYRLRVNMTVACTGTRYGVAIQQAQLARIYNPEFVVNGATNVVALGIGVPCLPDGSVTGVHVQDSNFDGNTDSGQTHIVIGGAPVCDDVVLSGDTWLEGPGDAGIRLDGGRGVDLGHLYLSGNPTNGTIYENTGQPSWKVNQIFNSGSNHINLTTVDGVLFKTFGSSDNVAADDRNVTQTITRAFNSTTSSLNLEGRYYVSSTSSITASWIYDTIDMDATGGTRVLTLPSAIGVASFRFTIRKKDSSGNAVTVGTTSSQNINASTTYSLATQYKYVTVESDGANWMVVANN